MNESYGVRAIVGPQHEETLSAPRPPASAAGIPAHSSQSPTRSISSHPTNAVDGQVGPPSHASGGWGKQLGSSQQKARCEFEDAVEVMGWEEVDGVGVAVSEQLQGGRVRQAAQSGTAGAMFAGTQGGVRKC